MIRSRIQKRKGHRYKRYKLNTFSDLLQVIKIESMKKLISIALLFPIHFVAHSEDIEYVITRYKNFANQIQKIEYHAHRIDTFTSEAVWNNKGYALIEREKRDSIFGFSFYGIRPDIERSFIYDEGIGFNINTKTKSYRIESGHPGMLGSPGGQMISQELFHLDNIYETRELIEKTDKFILKFKFKDNIKHEISQKIKIVELDKKSYLVTKVIDSYVVLGNKAVHQIILSNIKINEDVGNSISNYKSQIENFTIIQPEKTEPNALLNKHIPDIKLPKLSDEDVTVNLNTGKVTLLDFWEVWCGPCIKSLPEVEKIKQKYDDNIQVIGVVTQDKEKALSMFEKKNGTFVNLQGNKETLSKFGVNSFPRYFLIDDQGIIRKEYFGFSEQIEKDLTDLINKK